MDDVQRRIRSALDQMPIIDIHTHLGIRGPWQVRHLADLVSYHWVQVELSRAAGHLLVTDPAKDPEAYMLEVLPLLPYVRTTVNHWALMGILRDLYGLEEGTLTEDNWRGVDEAVRAHAEDGAWFNEVLRRAGVEKAVVGHAQGRPNEDCEFVPYASGLRLYAPETQEALQAIVGPGNPLPKTPDALASAIDANVSAMASENGVRAFHVSLGRHGDSPGWAYRPGDASQVASALQRLAADEPVPTSERDALVAFAADSTSAAVGRQGGLIQMFHGSIARTEANTNLPPTFGYWDSEFLQSHVYLFAENPDTTFDLLLSTRIPSHEAVSLVRVYFNVLVSGAWWHAFSPSTMRTMFRDRLELLPTTAWSAFFSDAYMVEWVYGKQLVTKHVLSRVLAEMVAEGYVSEDDAVQVAKQVLYLTPLATYAK